MEKIILMGYMGSGKSTVAKALSRKLHLKALDLDKIIEEQNGLSVAEIFMQKGEIFFRRQEHENLKSLLALPQSFILSLGGGTPCYSNNHELLKGENIVSVYLKGSIKTLADQLKKSKNQRPLIDSLPQNELEEFIAKHLFDRSFYYNQAQFKVSIDGKTIEALADEILSILA